MICHFLADAEQRSRASRSSGPLAASCDRGAFKGEAGQRVIDRWDACCECICSVETTGHVSSPTCLAHPAEPDHARRSRPGEEKENIQNPNEEGGGIHQTGPEEKKRKQTTF